MLEDLENTGLDTLLHRQPIKRTGTWILVTGQKNGNWSTSLALEGDVSSRVVCKDIDR